MAVGNRYRADLSDVAWGREFTYGAAPESDELAVIKSGSGNTSSVVNHLRERWGLVVGGIDLPNPVYDWQPFYGLGVMNRNMLFPIQGRERLEGRLSQVLLCHDASRMFLEQIFGLIFNGKNAETAVETTTAYSSSSSTTTITDKKFTSSGSSFASYKVANDNTNPTYIIIVADTLGATPDRTQDTWAYIGSGGGATELNVFKDRALEVPGWNGVRPKGGASHEWSIHGIKSDDSDSSSTSEKNVTADTTDNKIVWVRPTLVQPSFTLGARFRADDGSFFLTNYRGCKVSRAVFNFEEGNPVNFGADFIAQDMFHNIGEHDSSGDAEKTLKYVAEGATGTIPPNYMKDIRVTEQPYFFSNVNLTFKGEPIARFRRFSITIENGLDPRYYLTQNDQSSTKDNRQILHEILEGRRTISFSGSLDLDDDGDNAYPVSTSPTDAQFLRYLLNQSFTNTDIRDMETLKGIAVEIELMRTKDASGSKWDKIKFKLPSNTTTGNLGDVGEVGMVLRASPHNIPAPPNVHIPVDIDGMASSMHVEIFDGVASTA